MVQVDNPLVHFWSLQKGELRCLLTRNLLDNGFFPECTSPRGTKSMEYDDDQGFDYKSARRTIPSYANKLVFPEKFLTALRTVTMKESELQQVFSLLEEVRALGHHLSVLNYYILSCFSLLA